MNAFPFNYNIQHSASWAIDNLLANGRMTEALREHCIRAGVHTASIKVFENFPEFDPHTSKKRYRNEDGEYYLSNTLSVSREAGVDAHHEEVQDTDSLRKRVKDTLLKLEIRDAPHNT